MEVWHKQIDEYNTGLQTTVLAMLWIYSGDSIWRIISLVLMWGFGSKDKAWAVHCSIGYVLLALKD